MTLRILLVVPERHAREGLRAILADEGYDVTMAEDLPAAFGRLVAQPFDVLLLDSDLSTGRNAIMCGLDLLALARRRDTGVSAIVMASSPEDVPRNLASQGVLAILEKPVELSRLRRELAALAPAKRQTSVAAPSDDLVGNEIVARRRIPRSP